MTDEDEKWNGKVYHENVDISFAEINARFRNEEFWGWGGGGRGSARVWMPKRAGEGIMISKESSRYA